MEPVSNVGRFTRILVIIIGIVLIVAGAVITTANFEAIMAPKTRATITDFCEVDDGTTVTGKIKTALVTYTVNGKKYSDIELGQYEEQWKKGDVLYISYESDDPTNIKSLTMTYFGLVVILASFPFIIVGIYTLTNLNRRAAKTPEEIAEDEERTTAGKLKYKVSSIVISLSTGVPVLLIGLTFMFLEHNSAFGLLCLIMGAVATLVGLRSVILFFIIRHRHKKEFDKMVKTGKLLSAPKASEENE